MPDDIYLALGVCVEILPELYPRGLAEDEIPAAFAEALGTSEAEAQRQLEALREWIEWDGSSGWGA